MNKKLIALLLAGLLMISGVAAVISYARGADARAFDGAELASVLVVTAPVPAGSPSERLVGSVETKQVPTSVLAEGAVTDLASVAGEVTNSALVPGEQLIAGRFGEEVKEADNSALPAGFQQMDLIVNAPRVPEGTKVGDTVGVVASYPSTDGSGGTTRMTLNRIQLLAIKKGAAGDIGAATTADGVRVTLAVTTHQAERIANATEFGRVWLTLQNAETDIKGSKKTDAKVVLG